ncbi:MAG: hypothetical protein M1837_001426 [Sclerophora amabilis]|nr:MAG: hypothetical protein M1837_001426 [Sclerophora amabilis]
MLDQEPQTPPSARPAIALNGIFAESSHSLPTVADTSHYSLPLNIVLPNLWSSDTSATSSAGAGARTSCGWAADNADDEIRAANRATARRRLNGTSRGRNRGSKSTRAGNTTSNQPVVVRTYPKSMRAESGPRESAIREENEMSRIELPPVEAFGFEGILRAIEPEISGTLDAIAAICAKSRYSLSNQYEVHMQSNNGGGLGLTGDQAGLKDPRNNSDGSNRIHCELPRNPDQVMSDLINSGSSVHGSSGRMTPAATPSQGQKGSDHGANIEQEGNIIPHRKQDQEAADANSSAERETDSAVANSPDITCSKVAEAAKGREVLNVIDSGQISDPRESNPKTTPYLSIPRMLFSGFTSLSRSKPPEKHTASGLAASPAPHVLTATQLAVSSVRDARNITGTALTAKDAGLNQNAEPRRSQSMSLPISHQPRSSRLVGIPSWLSWTGKSHRLDPLQLSETSSPPVRTTCAENRLRTLLRATNAEISTKGKTPAR